MNALTNKKRGPGKSALEGEEYYSVCMGWDT